MNLGVQYVIITLCLLSLGYNYRYGVGTLKAQCDSFPTLMPQNPKTFYLFVWFIYLFIKTF